MKLRIKGDSIRLRLVRPEVSQLIRGGSVREITHFPANAALECVLCTVPPPAAIGASFENGVLTIAVPQALAGAWSHSEDVSIRGEVATASGTLSVLIEKDFPCRVERPFEDDSGAFDRDRLELGQ